jgi:hypothetical protein
MSHQTVLDPSLSRKIKALKAQDPEQGFISAACKRGQVNHGCTICFSIKCVCECHKRCPGTGKR